MKRLNSNGIKTSGQEWCGVDKLEIIYPQVSSCITVTCVVKGGLAGLHLASTSFSTDADLIDYGKIAKGATAMYVVGMLSRRWQEDSDSSEAKKNWTGLTYGASDGGTLIARLRRETGFTGVVRVNDTSSVAGELEITATLAESTAIFKVSSPELGEQSLTDFQSIGGNVILPTPNSSSRCVIL